ncbi:DUF3754 domain-containing protein [Stieleria sp. JC731]|uniref:DUF3754 domain-containing protein n=1 Tax=Pirellulaceae TaxID=2691357 RepID=UPI001E5999AA|nr:DUF3754 domain-containing protein [Stieleria sp. JC731]MCC9602073.1 DUF3754 domain-containing protein [Stieleria sp. JC731]
MSKSVERILTTWSLDGTGPLTRSIAEVSTTGWIEPDASHWSIESFVPIETSALLNHLREVDTELSTDGPRKIIFDSAVRHITHDVDELSARRQTQFSDQYQELDPDSDCITPQSAGDDEADPPIDNLIDLIESTIKDAGYSKLTQEDIEKCVGVASHWGVPMSANFDLFRHLSVYARGDIVGQRCHRNLFHLYRLEMVDVAIYQRLVVIFQLTEDHERGELLPANKVHLRIFKNIPKQDVDMLLPGTKIKLSGIDHAKVIVPSLSGWIFSLQKISRFVLVTLALAAYYSTALIIGLVLAGIGYGVKSFFGYFQTKNRYLLNLTRNLYFQKLDTNAGAGLQLVGQARRQRMNEAILAFYAVLSEEEPISLRRLRRKCERLVREAVDVEIDFPAERVVDYLLHLQLIEGDNEGRYEVIDPVGNDVGDSAG